MIKQKVEQYEITEEYNIAERIDKRIKQGYKIVSMMQTKEYRNVGLTLPIEKDVVLVMYEYEETINYPKMYSISSGIALLKNKDVKIYRTLMFDHVKGRRDESVYYTYLPNERTKEYKDIMEYCYLNNIILFEVKANGN
ncbi:hypothetical protein CS266P3_00060 [Clostridium phage CS266P3]|nr:hypothetical protein CS266P3_00060 [Clostridium phage CS266P3]